MKYRIFVVILWALVIYFCFATLFSLVGVRYGEAGIQEVLLGITLVLVFSTLAIYVGKVASRKRN